MQTCAACSHANAPERGFCGACGHMLRPVCRRCRFANDRVDRFCGGCGLPVPTSARVPSARVPVATAAATATSDQLDALFADESPENALPAAAITQDDLDRLFGSAS